MKRLSVGSQGTVDHRHRVKIQRRGGTWNFRARQFRTGEKWTKRIRQSSPPPPFDNPDQDNMHESAREDKSAFSPFLLRFLCDEHDIFFRETNLIPHEGVYIIWKIRIALVIDECISKEPSYLKLCIGTYVPVHTHIYARHIYAAAPVRCVCLVYLFYFILVYLGKAMSRGYIVSQVPGRAASAIFYTTTTYTPAHFSPRQCCVRAHPPRALPRLYSASSLSDIGCLCDSGAN